MLLSARLWSLQVRYQPWVLLNEAARACKFACMGMEIGIYIANRDTHQWWEENAAVVYTSSPCAMDIATINSYNNNWSHDSDSLLGISPVVSGARMQMYGLTHPKRPPHGKECRYMGTDRPNKDHTVKVGLECAGETSAVDHQGPFCLYLFSHVRAHGIQ